ncbi:MAG: hypothetical protein M3177_03015 [Pseudomonadota bacterium]|nr:hypothetical protein [Pseudomonadota bacterium]
MIATHRRPSLAPRLFPWLVLCCLLWLFGHAPAAAAVEVAFYSREMSGNHFPHAFVRLSGTTEAGGEPVDVTFGFTARRITPAILLGSVSGTVIAEPPRQVARSERQFTLTVSDADYRALLAAVEQWRSHRQPSYNLNRRNCVHFVAELARTLGLRTENAERLMKRPRAFLQHVRRLNAHLINAP